MLQIPKDETKSGKRDLSFELHQEVASRIRWYRQSVIPLLLLRALQERCRIGRGEGSQSSRDFFA